MINRSYTNNGLSFRNMSTAVTLMYVTLRMMKNMAPILKRVQILIINVKTKIGVHVYVYVHVHFMHTYQFSFLK